MKKTTKTKSKASPKIKIKQKTKKFPARYLGIILVTLLLLEGLLITHATVQDWQAGLSVLNMSGELKGIGQNLKEVFTPEVEALSALNQFYVAAAEEMIPMFDLSTETSSVADVWRGVNTFYGASSEQMAALLDVSGQWVGTPKVSGISITVPNQ